MQDKRERAIFSIGSNPKIIDKRANGILIIIKIRARREKTILRMHGTIPTIGSPWLIDSAHCDHSRTQTSPPSSEPTAFEIKIVMDSIVMVNLDRVYEIV
jgi:hypothetical protein